MCVRLLISAAFYVNVLFSWEQSMWAERSASGVERIDHISFRALRVFLKIPLRSLNTLSAARSIRSAPLAQYAQRRSLNTLSAARSIRSAPLAQYAQRRSLSPECSSVIC